MELSVSGKRVEVELFALLELDAADVSPVRPIVEPGVRFARVSELRDDLVIEISVRL